jgi:hypothetical protein
MNLPQILISQYLASLEMLKEAISKCPEKLWNNPEDKTKFWHLAYHALFYTHLYLQESEHSFTPWSKHRDEYQFLGQLPWPPHAPPKICEPYSKNDILEYLSFVQEQVTKCVPQLSLDDDSGFYWLPFNKLELQIYTIRHIQQHAGELMERLGVLAGIEINWVGTKPN